MFPKSVTEGRKKANTISAEQNSVLFSVGRLEASVSSIPAFMDLRRMADFNPL